MTPDHLDLTGIAEIDPKPPILWVHGADDVIVSDASYFDLNLLGSIGAVPGWPGVEVAPPQPMVSQTRAVLDRYRAGGGRVTELLVPDCGHSPHLEAPEAFTAALLEHIEPDRSPRRESGRAGRPGAPSEYDSRAASASRSAASASGTAPCSGGAPVRMRCRKSATSAAYGSPWSTSVRDAEERDSTRSSLRAGDPVRNA